MSVSMGVVYSEIQGGPARNGKESLLYHLWFSGLVFRVRRDFVSN